ncbi:enoyl-CoA hydratase/isomerase family protein [Mycolicibacter arupensis]|jgi:enoyl-CoA hydratase/carnithine racemase|uniref:Enoyl-CoA hydratase/isomerase family protein n=1 Tax=Mycolicibacter arupensis TaxID=342002 RepID=A0A5C7Y9L2_9MYCO|nr:enoyl-CoA hydratase/isomerase family protein [Mycolicibacter arupensis]MDM2348187.1 enoyl-CoA hydratase/isomerase family protein [Mycobacteroides abscessus]MDM2359115.1 enoyl-CoA hydratase/isomerase family protein [Mycobacteroides abscessus]TXI58366.1 MAG: enoyl-CoA hydratase/isomerase family protein [Mycolicibacter arupensis]
MSTQADTSPRFSVTRTTPALWRVTFDNPPINLVDPLMVVELHQLLTEIEQDHHVAVIVFESANPDFFLNHVDVAADPSPLTALPTAPSPFHHWTNLLIRISKLPAVTISAIRGRARAAGSELALATDIRFASRERAILGQFEVGFAAIPGGGPSSRLPTIVGRGRALEILLGGHDFTGELAERYGYVNRAIPDAEFDAFVDAFAHRVSRFHLLALADIKRFVNNASLPADATLLSEMDTLIGAFARPAAASIIAQALKDGFQQPGPLELTLGDYINDVRAAPGTLPTR